ncbi:MAG: Maf family protein, partial [Bacteroidota bacterium]
MFKPIQPFILASASPRRKELLEEAGLDFEVIKLNIDESHPDGLSPLETVDFLAKKKLSRCSKWLKERLVITADTLVFKGDHILGKPGDRQHAIEMLNQLSGSDHIVTTSVCIGYKKHIHQFNVSTKVTFTNLSQLEIEYYVDSYKPYD